MTGRHRARARWPRYAAGTAAMVVLAMLAGLLVWLAVATVAGHVHPPTHHTGRPASQPEQVDGFDQPLDFTQIEDRRTHA